MEKQRVVVNVEKTKVDFSRFHQELVSVLLKKPERDFVFVGVAKFQRDDQLGNILLIEPANSQPGNPHLILTEKGWKGRIIPDLHDGGRFCFIPDDKEMQTPDAVIAPKDDSKTN